ncbi:hypothetical protein [Xanthomonas sp. BRIP62418]|nr:hypothetical protein [Xanthomonas sp. BRIP62418]
MTDGKVLQKISGLNSDFDALDVPKNHVMTVKSFLQGDCRS